MERGDFISTCGFACLGFSSIAMVLQSCVAYKTVPGKIVDDHLLVPISNFIRRDDFQKYLIIRNDNLQMPIYLFRFSENEYTALNMKCTHQGTELNAYGDKLVCSAHGSEFNNKGDVTNGPAAEPLRSFPIHIDQNNIFISLKES